ncbi:MAG: deoxynucleoside kinase [Anaerolineales bacterium]|nr:deoxynucleoside kinase [Anaerolineales bacterium]
MKRFIAIAGNIGVGKSTLVNMLCEQMGWEPFFEPVAQNPYLADFYEDMSAWAFHSQVFFLTHRLRSHLNLTQHSSSVIQDRSLYEDAEIFAYNLYRQGNMSERDYQTYRDLYETAVQFLPPPDLVIYLRASAETLLSRISRRGRNYETAITEEYLQNLNTLYEGWIENFTLCPILAIPADDLDYVAHNGHLRLIVSKIEAKLSGKEEVVFEADEMAKAAED